MYKDGWRRRSIRLKDYDYSQPGYYFITVCVNHSGIDLYNEVLHEIVLKTLFDVENKYKNLYIDEYVIMPDHIHFLLQIKYKDKITVPEFMKEFKSRSTIEVIKKIHSGEVESFDKRFWQRNYYEHIIRNEADYYEKKRYIINNPLKLQ